MIRSILVITAGICVGLYLGFILFYQPKISLINPLGMPQQPKQIIGFLPYWELGYAHEDYGKTLTTFSYFSLTIDTDGKIKKLNTTVENEPGWNDLDTGQADIFLQNALKNNTKLSLVVFNGNVDMINQIITDPTAHARNLANDVKPIMQKHKFTDLNLDIEYTTTASAAARTQFVQFVTELKSQLQQMPGTTLTVAISPADFILTQLVDYKKIGALADSVVLMGYDYHSPSSYVTGPNAPLYGAGIDSEYDVKTLVEIALKSIPPEKVILGIPLYGYEWETLESNPRAAVLPGTGVIASNNRSEKVIASCADCNEGYDSSAQEAYVTYKDSETGTYHQIFYPDKRSTQTKVDYALSTQIAGVGLWALGYEGKTILEPLAKYQSE